MQCIQASYHWYSKQERIDFWFSWNKLFSKTFLWPSWLVITILSPSLNSGQCRLFHICVFFFIQLFDHVGKADMTITNTGSMGFNFSIKLPNREAEDVDEKPGGHKKDNKQHLNARQNKDDEQSDERQEVRPGQPVVIPSKVSSCSYYLRHTVGLPHTTAVYSMWWANSSCVVGLCVSGLHRCWCGAACVCPLPPRHPRGVWKAISAAGGLPTITRNPSDWRGSISQDQTELTTKHEYAYSCTYTNRTDSAKVTTVCTLLPTCSYAVQSYQCKEFISNTDSNKLNPSTCNVM